MALPDDLNFSLKEIQDQLESLGYYNVPPKKLLEFKRDLDELIEDEYRKSSSSREVATSTGAIPTVSASNNKANKKFVRKIASGSNQEFDHPDNYDLDLKLEDDSSYSDHNAQNNQLDNQLNNRLNDDVDDEDDQITSLADLTFTSRTPRKEDASGSDRLDSRRAHFATNPVLDIHNYTAAHELSAAQRTSGGPARKANLQARPLSSGRSDPVARFHNYSVAWQQQKPPGEKPHKQLRWSVKAAMMVQEVPQRVLYQPRIKSAGSHATNRSAFNS